MTPRISYGELFRRVRRDVVWHDCFAKSAALAFYFQLAIFPLLIFLLTLLGFMPGAQQTVLFWLARLMPTDAMGLINHWLHETLARRSRGILSFSLIFSLWSASTGVRTLIATLNRAYEVNEGRPFWQSQVLALGMTLALCILVIGGVVLITFADQLIDFIRPVLGIVSSVNTAWRVFHYATGLLMLTVGIALIYYFAPNVDQRWSSTLPGTGFAVTAFIAVSYLFSVYVRYAPSYYAVYGSLGAIVILNLWLYLMALVMYLGGEINSEIQKLSGRPAQQNK
jgi:membrane protein